MGLWGLAYFFYFFSLVSSERLQSTQYSLALRSTAYHKTCFGGHYIPRVQFRFKGQPAPFIPQ